MGQSAANAPNSKQHHKRSKNKNANKQHFQWQQKAVWSADKELGEGAGGQGQAVQAGSSTSAPTDAPHIDSESRGKNRR